MDTMEAIGILRSEGHSLSAIIDYLDPVPDAGRTPVTRERLNTIRYRLYFRDPDLGRRIVEVYDEDTDDLCDWPLGDLSDQAVTQLRYEAGAAGDDATSQMCRAWIARLAKEQTTA